MNLDVLYNMFDRLWEENFLGDSWKDEVLEKAKSDIKTAIGNVGKKIETNTLEKLREMKKPKLKSILETGATLASIGGFIMPLLDKINNS